MSTYNENLLWRYATKKFDPTKKLTVELLDELLEAPRLSASSFGLQPWKFVIVNDPQIRLQLRDAAYGQSQLTDASEVVVFCAKKSIDEAYIDQFVARTAEVRGVAIDSLQNFKASMMGVLKNSPEELSGWMRRQVYIALGFLLSSAAQHRVDACPMEGFDHSKFDDILGLGALGFESLAVCALGYRSSEDVFATQPKVRFSKDEIFIVK